MAHSLQKYEQSIECAFRASHFIGFVLTIIIDEVELYLFFCGQTFPENLCLREFSVNDMISNSVFK